MATRVAAKRPRDLNGQRIKPEQWTVKKHRLDITPLRPILSVGNYQNQAN